MAKVESFVLALLLSTFCAVADAFAQFVVTGLPPAAAEVMLGSPVSKRDAGGGVSVWVFETPTDKIELFVSTAVSAHPPYVTPVPADEPSRKRDVVRSAEEHLARGRIDEAARARGLQKSCPIKAPGSNPQLIELIKGLGVRTETRQPARLISQHVAARDCHSKSNSSASA